MSSTKLNDAINETTKIPPVNELIDSAIERKSAYVTLQELAMRCGLLRANSKNASPVFSMLRTGSMRLPMNKLIPVADVLNIDRRKLFTANLRDSIYNLTVKTEVPKIPDDREETEKEKAAREAAVVTRRQQLKDFDETWREMASLIALTHTEQEDEFLQAIREVEEEVGCKIEPDADTIKQFKSLLRDQYSL